MRTNVGAGGQQQSSMETIQGNKVLIWHLEFVTNSKAIYILELLKMDGKERGR